MNRSSSLYQRIFAVFLCYLLLVSVFSTPVVATAGETVAAADAQPALTEDEYVQGQTPSNNSSVRHENPDTAGRDGDTTQLRAYLIEKMVTRLGDGTVEIEQGEYQRGRDLIGDEYSELLDKYVDVEGSTGASSRLEHTREEQQEYGTDVQSYRDTYDEYQEAKQNGDEERARQLARELAEHESNVSQTGLDLTTSYERLSNRTGVETNDSQERIANITQNITDQQAEIRAAEFVETSLTLTTQQSQTSYLNPLSITGQLTTADGESLSNQNIILNTGSRQIQTQTDAEGHIATTFRPRTLPQGETTLTVRYVPEETSIYYGSNTTLNTSIEQVSGSVSLSEAPATTSFDDTVTVSGSVSVEDEQVSDLPLVVSMGGVELGTVQTTDAGSFSLTESVPAEVPAGEQSLTVSTTSQSQAIAIDEQVETVMVEPTETQLSVSGSQSSSSSVALQGELTTQTGKALAGQSVLIKQNGSTVASTTTNENGRFQTAVSTSDLEAVNSTVAFAAVFPGEKTNLEQSRAVTEVTLRNLGGESGSKTQESGQLSGLTTATVAIVAAIVIVVVAGFVWWRRREDEAEETTEKSEIDESETITSEPVTEPSVSVSPASSRLSLATDALADGRTDHAIELAYTVVREQFSKQLRSDNIEQQTHWEWYQTVADHSAVQTDLTVLQQLTVAYEHAAYRREELSAKDASDTLSAVKMLLGESQSTDTDGITSD
ncbi:hypothetical protein FCF25_02205 [Haloprofundus sp. MHR1]|nr:hypothetical protein FCF25_02205 [Haloprofundus sp. MHR1]